MTQRTEHQHEIVFIGMINVDGDDELSAVIDVWRCRECRKIFCEDRRFGEKLKPGIGFKEIPDDEEWAILTCTDINGVHALSISAAPGKKITHTCVNGAKQEFTIDRDWTIQDKPRTTMHMLFLVKDYMNKVIEAGYSTLKSIKQYGAKANIDT